MKKILQSQYGARNRRLLKQNMSYHEYLNSQMWSSIREQLKSFPEFKKCYCCDKKGKVEMHHKHYRNLFKKEIRYHRESILPLCRKCHQEVHDLSLENDWGLRQAARRLRKLNCL